MGPDSSRSEAVAGLVLQVLLFALVLWQGLARDDWFRFVELIACVILAGAVVRTAQSVARIFRS